MINLFEHALRYYFFCRYKNIIRGQFYGHTHYDEFKVFYDEDGTPMNIAYVAPSQTTWEHYNPAYRIYTIDAGYTGASMVIMNFVIFTKQFYY